MKTKKINFFPVCCAIVVCLMLEEKTAEADDMIRPFDIFTSDMVLQRQKPIRISGRAAPGTQVDVTLDGTKGSALTGKDGIWEAVLPPKNAGGPYELTIAGKNQVIRLVNIMIGEVWLCSGQSNMEWGTGNEPKANYPEMRLLQVNLYRFSPDRCEKIEGRAWEKYRKWEICTPKTVWKFSRVGFFFGLHLMKELKVPVGLIVASWGGTTIEPWISREGYEALPTLKSQLDFIAAKDAGSEENRRLTRETITANEAWLKKAKEDSSAGKLIQPPPFPDALRPFFHYHQPTVLFNSMIAPVTPLNIRGVIWYQGEANIADGMLYKDKLRALLISWRKEFRNPDMAFHLVQLAPYGYGGIAAKRNFLPAIWEAQKAFADSEKNTGIAVINDHGDPKNIHPNKKEEVGRRLALLALKYQYGRNINADSPSYAGKRVENGKLILSFENAGGLKTRDGKKPTCFEVAGADHIYYPADATIHGPEVILSSSRVSNPENARFAWNETAIHNLCSSEGLPVSPFRTEKP